MSYPIDPNLSTHFIGLHGPRLSWLLDQVEPDVIAAIERCGGTFVGRTPIVSGFFAIDLTEASVHALRDIPTVSDVIMMPILGIIPGTPGGTCASVPGVT